MFLGNITDAIPTLMMSAPANTNASTMSPVTTLPACKGTRSMGYVIRDTLYRTLNETS